MSSAKKEWFREVVKDRIREKLRTSMDKLNQQQLSYWMTKVYVDEVIRIQNPAMVPDDPSDLEECFVDSSGDAGVDFISRNEDHVLIIQAKYHGDGKRESPESFDYFTNVLGRLHPKIGKADKKHQKLQNIIADIEWDTDSFDLHFITLGKINDAMRERESSGQRPIPDLPGIEDQRVEIALVDEGGLNERLRDAHAALSGVRTPVTLQFQKTLDKNASRWIRYETLDGKRAWVGLTSAKQLSNLKKFRDALFDKNIRNYIGDNAKNKEIRKTAIEDPEHFFFFNNGISAVATKVTELPDGTGLECEEFSIINGAQTFRSLVKAQSQDATKAGDACVLLRVTEVSLRQKTTEIEFVEKVTRFNNTQNAVLVSDFRSNDGVQRALRKKFENVTRGNGKHYFYRNKRSNEKPRDSILISMEEFAQTIHSFRYGPIDAKGGKRYLFDAGAKGGYAKIFGTDGRVWDAVTQADFERLAGEWFLCCEARIILAESRDEHSRSSPGDFGPLVKAALERRWIAYFALGEMIRQKYNREHADLDSSLRRLARARWIDDGPTKGDYAVLKSYCDYVVELLARLYRTATHRQGFVPRNWFRNEQTLDDIRTELGLSKLLMDNLPLFSGISK